MFVNGAGGVTKMMRYVDVGIDDDWWTLRYVDDYS